MANERQVTRFYTDVAAGYQPEYCSFQAVMNGQLPAEVSEGQKRIWIEVEMPSDLDLWPERLRGFEIGIGSIGQRQIQIDSPPDRPANRPEPAQAEVAEEDRPRRRPRPRRIDAGEAADPEERR